MSHQEQVSKAALKVKRYLLFFNSVFVIQMFIEWNALVVSGWGQRVPIVVNQALSGQSQYGQNIQMNQSDLEANLCSWH